MIDLGSIARRIAAVMVEGEVTIELKDVKESAKGIEKQWVINGPGRRAVYRTLEPDLELAEAALPFEEVRSYKVLGGNPDIKFAGHAGKDILERAMYRLTEKGSMSIDDLMRTE